MFVGCRTSEPYSRADFLRPAAASPHTDDLRVDRLQHTLQPNVPSILVIAAADGGGRHIAFGVWPTRSENSTFIVGHVLK
jgi:hypothetical protein